MNHLILAAGATLLGIGLGWDEKVPLSFWPRLYDHTTSGGNRARGFAWCGVFAQHTAMPAPSPTHRSE